MAAFVCKTCRDVTGHPLKLAVAFVRHRAATSRRVRRCPGCGFELTTLELPQIDAAQLASLAATSPIPRMS